MYDLSYLINLVRGGMKVDGNRVFDLHNESYTVWGENINPVGVSTTT